MNCRDAIRPCNVANDDCTAPANLQAANTRATCFACGHPVCTRCSRRIDWYDHGRRRVCDNCVDDQIEDLPSDLQRLKAMAARYDLRPDWHEPGEYHGDLQAVVKGRRFDNAGVEGEKIVVFRSEGREVMHINLATLCALAASAKEMP